MFDKLRAKLTGVPSLNELIEEVPAHIGHYLGPLDDQVFHELVSDKVHIDVHFGMPNPERGYRVVFTTGMAMRAMPRQTGDSTPQLAELMLLMPNDWPMEQESFKDEAHYWPIRALKMIARMPHDMGFCLRENHSIPFEDPPRPAPGTEFGGVLVVDPTFWPPHVSRVKLKSGIEVKLYVVMPLTMKEMEFKASQERADGLLSLIKQKQLFNETSMIVNPARASMV